MSTVNVILLIGCAAFVHLVLWFELILRGKTFWWAVQPDERVEDTRWIGENSIKIKYKTTAVVMFLLYLVAPAAILINAIVGLAIRGFNWWKELEDQPNHGVGD